jgi:hypothetical protein
MTAIGREGDAKREYERQQDRYEDQQRREARSRWTATTLADAAGQENALGSVIQSLESSYGGLREAVESVGGRIDGSGAHAVDARGRFMQWANTGAASSLASFWKTGSLVLRGDDLLDVCERHVELSDERLEMVLTVRLPDGSTEVRKARVWRDEHKPPHHPFVIYRADLPERPPEPVTHTVREEDPGMAELLEEVRRAKEAARRRKCGWCGTMNEPWSDYCDGCRRSF